MHTGHVCANWARFANLASLCMQVEYLGLWGVLGLGFAHTLDLPWRLSSYASSGSMVLSRHGGGLVKA